MTTSSLLVCKLEEHPLPVQGGVVWVGTASGSAVASGWGWAGRMEGSVQEDGRGKSGCGSGRGTPASDTVQLRPVVVWWRHAGRGYCERVEHKSERSNVCPSTHGAWELVHISTQIQGKSLNPAFHHPLLNPVSDE